MSAEDEYSENAESAFDGILAWAIAQVKDIPIEVCRDRFHARHCWACGDISWEREVATPAGPVLMWDASHYDGCPTEHHVPPANPIWN